VVLKRGIILTIKITLAASLLFWLAWSGRLDFRVLSSVASNWPWFVAAQLLFGLVQWMTAVRWRWFLQIVGQKCSVARAFQLTLAGLLFNQVLIGSTGGDIYRVMAFETSEVRQRVAIAVSVATDRLIGLFALVAIIPAAALWNYSLISESTLLMVIVAGCVMAIIGLPILVWLFFRWNTGKHDAEPDIVKQSRLTSWLGYLTEGAALFSGHRALVVKSIAFSIVIQAMIVGVNVFLAISILGTDISWQTFFLLIPIALLAMAVPINPPGALGTGEAIYAVLLEFVGIAQGGMISLLHRFTNILWALPGSLAFIMPARQDTRAISSFNHDLDSAGNGK